MDSSGGDGLIGRGLRVYDVKECFRSRRKVGRVRENLFFLVLFVYKFYWYFNMCVL